MEELCPDLIYGLPTVPKGAMKLKRQSHSNKINSADLNPATIGAVRIRPRLLSFSSPSSDDKIQEKYINKTKCRMPTVIWGYHAAKERS